MLEKLPAGLTASSAQAAHGKGLAKPEATRINNVKERGVGGDCVTYPAGEKSPGQAHGLKNESGSPPSERVDA